MLSQPAVVKSHVKCPLFPQSDGTGYCWWIHHTEHSHKVVKYLTGGLLAEAEAWPCLMSELEGGTQ